MIQTMEIDYTKSNQNRVINYVGADAFKVLYRRIKRRIDSVDKLNVSIVSRIDVIEAEATNVIALTDEELLSLIEEARKEEDGQDNQVAVASIEYTKTTINYTK